MTARTDDACVPTERSLPPGRAVSWQSLVLALSVAAGTYAVVASGVLPGVVAVAAAGLLLCLVPTADELSRRLATNGGLLIGWMSLGWWVVWPVPVNHAAVAMAATVGGLIVWSRLSRSSRRGRGVITPVVGAADLLLLLPALVASASVSRWLAPGSPRAALVALLPGADNYAHFHLFSTIRSHEGTTSALGPSPDGSRWAFFEYPQGFHALAASVSELLHPRVEPGPGMLVAYTQSVGVLLLLGTVVLTAAVVSAPLVRDRAVVALPAVVLATTALWWEPGQGLLADGFANFWLASVAVATALVLTLVPDERFSVPHVAAVTGLLVFTAHAWAPLLVLAVPAGIVTLRACWSRHPHAFPAGSRTWWSLAVLGAGALAVARAAVALLTDVPVKAVVTGVGGIHGTSPIPVLALVIVAVPLFWLAPSLTGSPWRAEGLAWRVRLLAMVPVTGVLVCAALYVVQLRELGTSSYYLLKFFMGLELVLAVVVPAVAAVVLAGLAHDVAGRRVTAAAVLAALVATQAFGRLPDGVPALLDQERPGTAALPPGSAGPIADGVLSAVRQQSPAGSFDRDYVALEPHNSLQPFYTDGWYHGVLASLSSRGRERLSLLSVPVDDVETVAPLVRRLLDGDASRRVVVAPAHLAAMRDAVGPVLAPRVVPWASGG